MEITVGSILEGTVKTITKFGAFVVLPGGRSGLVHISEISHSYVNDVKDHLQEGQEVSVKVVGIDEAGRINLSIKKTMDPPAAPAFRNNNNSSAPGQNRRPFEGNRDRDREGGGGGFRGGQGGGGNFRDRDGQGQGGGFRGPKPASAQGFRPAPPAPAPTDFENMMKQYMQNADSKLSSLRMHEKRSSRRSGHH